MIKEFLDFIILDKRLSPEVIENLHYQFIRGLENEGLIASNCYDVKYEIGKAIMFQENLAKIANGEGFGFYPEDTTADSGYCSEKGILNRHIRSIHTGGHFGDIKENKNFRRFHYRSSEKVYKEFLIFAIERNVNKYHRFLNEKIKKYEGKTEQKTV